MLKISLAAFAVLAVAIAISRIALGPMERLSQSRRIAFQFQLIDFTCLLVYLQAILGVCLRLLPRDEWKLFVLIGGTGLAAALLFWSGAVFVLSRAGIRDIGRRAACMLILIPATAGLILITGVATFSGILLVLQVNYGVDSAVELQLVARWLLGGILAAVLLRFLSRWVAAGATFVPAHAHK